MLKAAVLATCTKHCQHSTLFTRIQCNSRYCCHIVMRISAATTKEPACNKNPAISWQG